MSLDWIDETRELGAGGRATTRRASAEECKSVAAALGILACNNLVFDYTLKPIADGRYRLKGTLKADVTQECVVSLEPVPATIEEEVRIEFWPPHLLAERRVNGEHVILGETDPEPIGQPGRIETGRIAFEVLSAALDPYPRKEGVEFHHVDPEDDVAAAREHPFAVLAQLKQQKPEGS